MTITTLQPINKLTSQCEIWTLWTELTKNNFYRKLAATGHGHETSRPHYANNPQSSTWGTVWSSPYYFQWGKIADHPEWTHFAPSFCTQTKMAIQLPKGGTQMGSYLVSHSERDLAKQAYIPIEKIMEAIGLDILTMWHIRDLCLKWNTWKHDI